MKPQRVKYVPAFVVADLVGFVRPKPIEGHPEPKYGIKALVGQYVRQYTRQGHLPSNRVSKGAQKRYEREHGTESWLDYSGAINARR